MDILISIPNEDTKGIVDVAFHFCGGHLCECGYPFTEIPKGLHYVCREDIERNISRMLSDTNYLNKFCDANEGSDTIARAIVRMLHSLQDITSGVEE